jgi:hypothetical protein
MGNLGRKFSKIGFRLKFSIIGSSRKFSKIGCSLFWDFAAEGPTPHCQHADRQLHSARQDPAPCMGPGPQQTAGPMAQNLECYLNQHPSYELYQGQDLYFSATTLAEKQAALEATCQELGVSTEGGQIVVRVEAVAPHRLTQAKGRLSAGQLAVSAALYAAGVPTREGRASVSGVLSLQVLDWFPHGLPMIAFGSLQLTALELNRLTSNSHKWRSSVCVETSPAGSARRCPLGPLLEAAARRLVPSRPPKRAAATGDPPVIRSASIRTVRTELDPRLPQLELDESTEPLDRLGGCLMPVYNAVYRLRDETGRQVTPSPGLRFIVAARCAGSFSSCQPSRNSRVTMPPSAVRSTCGRSTSD